MAKVFAWSPLTGLGVVVTELSGAAGPEKLLGALKISRGVLPRLRVALEPHWLDAMAGRMRCTTRSGQVGGLPAGPPVQASTP